MLNLRELYLSYNEIVDISPLTMLEELQIVDLEGCVKR
jgi:Leucine-rich repeat (LRR) protein